MQILEIILWCAASVAVCFIGTGAFVIGMVCIARSIGLLDLDGEGR